jgi:hypothetical protein
MIARQPFTDAFISSFCANCNSILEYFCVHPNYDLRLFFYSFIRHLINNCPEALAVGLFGVLCRLIVPLKSTINPVMDTYSLRTDSHSLSRDFFNAIRALIVRFPSLLRPGIVEFAGVLTSFMDDMTDYPLAQSECFTFLVETVGDCADQFFGQGKGSYTKFLRSFAGVTLDGSGVLMHRVFQFMPSNGFDKFFDSDLFSRFSRQLLPGPESPLRQIFTSFIMDHVTESNLKSVTSCIWNDSLFYNCTRAMARGINYRNIYFFRMTWTILERFPSAVETFYDNGRHISLWKCIKQKNITIPELKMFAYTLSVFNSRFTVANRNVQKWLRPRVQRLAESYEPTPEFPWLFALLRRPEPHAICDDGICRLIASFAETTEAFATEAFKYLTKREDALLWEVDPNTQRFVSELVVSLCQSYAFFVRPHKEQIREIVTREFRAIVQARLIDFALLNPLCNALFDMNAEDFERFSDLIDSLCRASTNLAVFREGVIQLVIAVATPELAVHWISHFWNLLSQQLKYAIDYRNPDAIAAACATVNTSSGFIHCLTERFQLGPEPIIANKNTLQSFAVLLQGMFVPGSAEALVFVTEWLSQTD